MIITGRKDPFYNNAKKFMHFVKSNTKINLERHVLTNMGHVFYQKKNCRPEKKREAHAAAAWATPRTRGREARAVITARNSAATPDARTKNKRVCHSYTLSRPRSLNK